MFSWVYTIGLCIYNVRKHYYNNNNNERFILRRKMPKKTQSLHIGKMHDQHLEACCRGISKHYLYNYILNMYMMWHYFDTHRSVAPCRLGQGGELEAEVWEPSTRPVHREPDGCQCSLSEHQPTEQVGYSLIDSLTRILSLPAHRTSRLLTHWFTRILYKGMHPVIKVN